MRRAGCVQSTLVYSSSRHASTRSVSGFCHARTKHYNRLLCCYAENSTLLELKHVCPYYTSRIIRNTQMASSKLRADVNKGPKKLKDPSVCRVFFSSPFNGMEGEREELTRRYWPQLASACNSVGVRFVPVDLRWGITTDQSTTYQTLNICLREIDRSDLFVGFFGQRYGWRGVDDKALQLTFDAAVGRYPWLEKVRDRSVTEIEFLHGHLNRPGKLPTIIGFRDKSFDDRMRAIGEDKGDSREVMKYSAESDGAVTYMKDLISRVKDTERTCLALKVGYSDPTEGARFMFEHVLKFVQDVVLKQDAIELSARQKQLAQHSAFLASHCSSYHGGQDYITRLDARVKSKSSPKPLLVIGEPGSGKSAALCNWLHGSKAHNAQGSIYIYHFVECTQNSSDPHNILQRMIWELRNALASTKKKAGAAEMDDPTLDAMDNVKLLNEWVTCLQAAAEAGRNVVVVVDGLRQIQYKEKIVRPLFWLPKSIPDGIHIVVSTDSTDKATIEELVDVRGYDTLSIEPLSTITRREFCSDVLQQRGKTLNNQQLAMVVNANRTSNPLFLKLVLEELCMFGRFRELDKKIDSLIKCSSSTELFRKYLERLENDYNPTDANTNLTERVMCSLCVSRHGLTEAELTEMHQIPSHVWSPFYFAIEPFLVKLSGGFMRLSQSALLEAVREKYMHADQSETSVLRKQIDFFTEKYSNAKRNDEPIPEHWYTELPWLCFKVKNKETLSSLILSVPVFLKLYELQKYNLLEYVEFIETSTEDSIKKFDHSIDVHMADIYARQMEDLVALPNVVYQTISVVDTFALFFSVAKKIKLEEYFLLRLKNIAEKASSGITESYRSRISNIATYRLACLYVDVKEYEKAVPLHESVLKFYQNKLNITSDESEQLARSYHGCGTAYVELGEYDKAEKCFEESMRRHQSLSKNSDSMGNVYKSMSCIGQLHSKKGNYEIARDKFEEVIRCEEELYKDSMPPETSYTMSNLGICYRRLGQFDKAEEVYKKALKIKVNAVGHNHFDVAYAYFNLSNLARDREQYDEAIQHMHTTLDIFKNIDFGDSVDAIYAKENIALIYLQQKRMDEGLAYFWEVFGYMTSRNQLHLSLPVVFDNYLIHLLRRVDHDGVRKVARAMIGCKEMRSYLPYLFLHYVDRQQPSSDKQATIDPEESIDQAIRLYPHQKDLIYQKIELDLLPSREVNTINDLLETYEKSLKEFDEKLVVQVCELLESDQWQDGMIQVYEYWLNKQPEQESFLRNLAIAYYQSKELDKALDCFQRAVVVNPSEPILQEKVAYLQLCTGDYDACRTTVEQIERNWSDNETLMKQIRLYRAELDNIDKS